MLWLKLSATFHEHPKMLAVRKLAGSRADSAELGWYRLLMAAKRYERWSFASEDHLEHVAGSFYRFVPFYREAHLLDGLIVHDGDSYNAIKSAAERKAEQRERDAMSQPPVTPARDSERDTVSRLERESRESREKTRAKGKTNGEPFTDPVLIAQREAILAKYGPDDVPIVPQPTALLTGAELEREANRLEALALHERFQRGDITEPMYERLRADIGKGPDDLTRLDA